MSDDATRQPMPAGHEADEAEQRVRSAVKDCVHCGFCLPACPTYSLWGEEMDSPRGRIHLVGQLLDGAPLTPATAGHFDRCLGCMACMTACPSGVQYDQIIEAAREWTEAGVNPLAGGRRGRRTVAGASGGRGGWRRGWRSGGGVGEAAACGRRCRREPTAPRPLADRLTREAIFALFPYPRRLRVAIAPLRLAQRTGADRLLARSGLVGRVSPAAEQALRLAPASRPLPPGRLPERVPALGTRRAVVGMLTGCVQSVFYPRRQRGDRPGAGGRGVRRDHPALDQGCCGALSLHSGRAAEATRFAKADDRDVRGGRRGRDRRELGRVRVGHEGVRAAVRRAGRGASGGRGGGRPAASPALPGQLEAASWSARAALLSARVRDFSEFLDELGPVAARRPVPVRGRLPRRLPPRARAADHRRSRAPCCARSPRLDLVELRDAGVCCGSAGVYNLLQPDAASALGSAQGRLGRRLRRVPPHLRQPRLHAADLGRAGGPGRDDPDRAHRRDSRRLDQRRTARLILGRICAGRKVRASGRTRWCLVVSR